MESIKTMELTKEQWAIIEPHLPAQDLGRIARGRPRVDAHHVLEGILWVLGTGSRWKDLPKHYPPYQTCHRRYLQWLQSGVLDKILHSLAEDLKRRHQGGDGQDKPVAEPFQSTEINAKDSALAAKAVSSWQCRAAMVLHSECSMGVFNDSRSVRREDASAC